MLDIGSYNNLVVAREVDFGYYLEAEDRTEVLLPRKYFPEGAAIGDMLCVFVYTDSQDRPIATNLTPKAIVGEFACLQVKDVNQYGAFLDWGLEKDLFVPFKLQSPRMEVGKSYVVRLSLDEVSNRVIASSRLGRFFEHDTSALEVGQKVELMIYEKTDLGIKAIVDHQYSGVLYWNEIFEELEIGELREGYIKKVRDDSLVDVSLNKQGYEVVEDLRPVILSKLKEAGGFLPYHSKSDAAQIQQVFKMSKKVFKKIIGGLYKDGTIAIADDGIRLTDRQ
jgi:predicted RNA-binding protein (virulence factor B family)